MGTFDFRSLTRSGAVPVLLVVVAALAPYIHLPFNPLIHDGPLAIERNQAVQSGPLTDLFGTDFWGNRLDSTRSTGSYRPLVSLTYAVQARLLGSDAAWFHLADMVIHALSAVLLLLLLDRLALARRWSLLATLLFALHPLQTEAVCSGVGRADLLAALCLLGALNLYLRHRSRLMQYGSMLLLAAAMLCKEYAVVFPFILIAVDVGMAWREGRKPEIRKLAPFWICSLVVLAGYLALRYSLIGSLGGVPMLGEGDHPLYGEPLMVRWSTACRLFLLSARLSIWPAALNHHYVTGTLPMVRSFLQPAALAGIGLVLVMVAGSIWWLRRRLDPVPLIAVVLFLSPLAPSLNTVSLAGVFFAERWLYIPVAGVSLLAGWGLDRFVNAGKRTTIAFVAVSVLLLMAGLASSGRVGDWSSMEKLALSSVERYPGGGKVWEELGLEQGRKGKHREAAESFERSLRIQPGRALVWRSYATALTNLGRHQEAVTAWKQAIDNAPADVGHFWRELGRSWLRARNPVEAAEALTRAHELLPGDIQVLLDLGQAYILAGRAEEAVDILRNAGDDVEGGRRTIDTLLGNSLLRIAQRRLSEGKSDEAANLAQEAVETGSLPPDGIFLAGMIAFRAGRREQAGEWFGSALEADPDLLRKKHQTAMQLEAAGRYQDEIALLQEILAAKPDHVPTLFNLGRVCMLAGRHDLAIAPLRRGLAIREDPQARGILDMALRQAAAGGDGR